MATVWGEPAVRLVDGYVSHDEAEAALFLYAEMLRERGEVARFGVFLRRVPSQGWLVYIRDRGVAST